MVCLCYLLLYDVYIYKTNMKRDYLVCRKNTDNVNSKMIETRNGRLQLKSQSHFMLIKKVDL